MNNDNYLGTATYSPEDNKLRLYPFARLSAEDYTQVKAAGFSWAPKQELFVAPMWTPGREDILIELCGEIGDEDKSLVERAEARAERFEDYSEKRASDADRAQRAVAVIADNIPLGQPILVGHHSEKHARRDAEKIENGMRRAVKMWEESKYWTERAAGAICAAKYKERPEVRARRIKKIEAEQRKQEREKAQLERCLRIWSRPNLTHEQALAIAGGSEAGYLSLPRKEGDKPDFSQQPTAYDGLSGHFPNLYAPRTVGEVVAVAKDSYPRVIARGDRWLAHYANRLAYERAMLAADGGTIADRTGPEKGGACKCWASPRGAWSYIVKVNQVSVTVFDNWGNGGPNFTRTIPFDKLTAIMTRVEVEAHREAGELLESGDKTGFFVRGGVERPATADEMSAPVPAKPESAAPFEAMKESLRAGVRVVTAPQLFPTPADLAERMADLADLMAGQKVLEPSAGTGVLIKAVAGRGIFHGDLTAVEINVALAAALSPLGVKVVNADFLQCNGSLGQFDRIVMNPPFVNGADIKHIEHALDMLGPGGRLVALCANGSRQQEKLQPLADSWEELPADTFKSEGTGVHAVLLTITK